jgi:hypothetical protein
MNYSILKSVTALLSRFLTVSFCVCCLAACSKPTETRFVSWKIITDGKIVVEKGAVDDKVPALNLQYLELRLKIEAACNLARFISEVVPANSHNETSSDVLSPRVVNLVQRYVRLNLAPDTALLVNQKMGNHLCEIQKEEIQTCIDESRKTSTKVPEDHLQLLAYMQNQFGMTRQGEIFFGEEYMAADKVNRKFLSHTIKLDLKSFSCDLLEHRKDHKMSTNYKSLIAPDKSGR